MSSFDIQKTKITKVVKHPNADKLDLIEVDGWQTVSQRGLWNDGDEVLYLPPDTMIMPDLAEKMEITNYLKNLNKRHEDYGIYAGRVAAIRLRGEKSFGILVRPDFVPDGEDPVEFLKLKKYQPPEVFTNNGKSRSWNPLLMKYTDIGNWQKYKHVFVPDEEVVCTEKIHGTCCLIGLIEKEFIVSSKNVNREIGSGSIYENPLESVKQLLEYVAYEMNEKQHGVVTIYGEVYGTGVQDLGYAMPSGSFVAFDIMASGEYLDYDDFSDICKMFEVPTTPVVYRGAYYENAIDECTSGNTVISDTKQIREGVVIRPVKERRHSSLGRVCLKSVSVDYLSR